MRTPLPRSRGRAVFALLAAVLFLPGLAQAQTEPMYATASVDGNTSEWFAGSGTPLFANMYRAAKSSKPVESKLYLRYDCATSIMYVLVMAEPGLTILASNPHDSFVKFGNSNKVVGGDSGDDGTPPDFAWVGYNAATKRAAGWEASFFLSQPGSYGNLNVHTQVLDGAAQTSAVEGRAIRLDITCPADPCANPGEAPSWAGQDAIAYDADNNAYLVFSFPNGAEAVGFYDTHNFNVLGGLYTGATFVAGDGNLEFASGSPTLLNDYTLSTNTSIEYGGVVFPMKYLIRYTGAGSAPGGTVYVKVANLNSPGRWASFYIWMLDSCGFIRDVDPELVLRRGGPAELPQTFGLEQNFPNPFNPSTIIRFNLPEASPVKLTVYDLGGREVRTLFVGDLEAGTHEATWDGRNASGEPVSSGLYLYRIEAGSFTRTMHMTLLK